MQLEAEQDLKAQIEQKNHERKSGAKEPDVDRVFWPRYSGFQRPGKVAEW